ncbi:3-methyladenine DNA glycosylase/8-oxoguanine DNA glycosylase [Neomicrococcus aestuarii]|uniref:DNA-3-methyladenine glycosylase II n=2 Tax=Neomicrococcus aestuarii TaxID=556325 RepID=A0A7W8WXW8_9MICC|nr:3-methyladenine DNA glycosylase/8-oxoguanine DNA glycosylase [Neomicrococcus aestuarii]
MTEIAYAAGFGSIRQFNDTMALEYGTTPSQLRRASSAQEATVQKGTAELRNASSESLQLSLRLKFRPPYDIDAMFGFFERHTVRGREIFSPASNDGTPATFTRVLDLENGIGKVSLPANVSGDSVHVQLEVPDLSGLPPILQNLRRWLDLDADPTIIGTALRSSEILHPLVSARPGIRIPGSLNPYETSIFTVLGQQVSLAAARTFQTRFIENFGQSSRDGWYAFPALSDLQAIPPLEFQAAIGLTRARSETLSTLIRALVKDVSFDTSEDPASVRQHLHAIRGIGPWTVEYIAMRCLADPDAFPASDLVIQRALGAPSSRIVGTMAEAWKPWRGYAAMHLWEFELQRKKSTEQ